MPADSKQVKLLTSYLEELIRHAVLILAHLPHPTQGHSLACFALLCAQEQRLVYLEANEVSASGTLSCCPFKALCLSQF